LAVLLTDLEPAVACASAVALARIGGKEAAAALSAAYDRAQGALRSEIAASLLVRRRIFPSGIARPMDMREIMAPNLPRPSSSCQRQRKSGGQNADAL
jgi:hypothetical protein